MTTTLADIKIISETIAFIVLMSTFLGILYKAVRTFVMFVSKTWKRLEVAFEQLEYVHKEVKPNHGSSLYDGIKTINRELAMARQDILVQHAITRQIRDDMASVPYCELSPTGDLIFSNKTFQEIFHMDALELKDKGWFALLPEEARMTVYNRWVDSMENRTPFQATLNVTSCDNKGCQEIVPYIMKTEQIRSGNGEVIYVIGKIARK